MNSDKQKIGALAFAQKAHNGPFFCTVSCQRTSPQHLDYRESLQENVCMDNQHDIDTLDISDFFLIIFLRKDLIKELSDPCIDGAS